MPTYVSLIKWTEEGVKDVKETVKRAEKSTALVEKFGGRFVNLVWTQGTYDLVCITEFADEDSAQACLLTIAKDGNVRTETLRAFSAQEMQRILDKIP